MVRGSSSALFSVLALFAVVSVVRAQEPAADDAARVRSGPQAQPQPQTAKPETPAPSEHSSAADPQPASDSQPTPTKSPPVTTVVVHGGPSSDILRSARNAGFTVKIAGGTTHFCKSEAPIGTRLVSERCLNEDQLTLFLERAQDQREKLSHLLGAPATSH